MPIRFFENGDERARYAVRLRIVNGKRERWAVALQVVGSDGRFQDIVRYHDRHGPLHKHSPGFPPGKPIAMALPPDKDPILVAVGDIGRRADEYIDLATNGYFLEVESDDDEGT